MRDSDWPYSLTLVWGPCRGQVTTFGLRSFLMYYVKIMFSLLYIICEMFDYSILNVQCMGR